MPCVWESALGGDALACPTLPGAQSAGPLSAEALAAPWFIIAIAQCAELCKLIPGSALPTAEPFAGVAGLGESLGFRVKGLVIVPNIMKKLLYKCVRYEWVFAKLKGTMLFPFYR